MFGFLFGLGLGIMITAIRFETNRINFLGTLRESRIHSKLPNTHTRIMIVSVGRYNRLETTSGGGETHTRRIHAAESRDSTRCTHVRRGALFLCRVVIAFVLTMLFCSPVVILLINIFVLFYAGYVYNIRVPSYYRVKLGSCIPLSLSLSLLRYTKHLTSFNKLLVS